MGVNESSKSRISRFTNFESRLGARAVCTRPPSSVNDVNAFRYSDVPRLLWLTALRPEADLTEEAIE